MRFQEVKKFILSKLRKELPKHLTYHSVEHVNDVYGAAESIGKREGIEGRDLKLLLTAALFHDSGFLRGPKDHESVSCDIAREYLPQFGYSDKDIETICGMIMATRIPQTPHNLLEEIICDADLDYLGRDDFFKIGNQLFDELCVYGIISNEIEWNKLQVRFLESHNYFTRTALNERKAQKDEHLRLVKSQIH
jgi:predicted metal-dependent HD superfamily phosphohydrolase